MSPPDQISPDFDLKVSFEFDPNQTKRIDASWRDKRHGDRVFARRPFRELRTIWWMKKSLDLSAIKIEIFVSLSYDLKLGLSLKMFLFLTS